jgi:uncharacterized protein
MASASPLRPRNRRVYVDTSVWVAVLAKEPDAAALMHSLEAETGQLLTSAWTRTEFASALAIKARRQELTQDDVSALLREFDLWVSGAVAVMPVDSADFAQAAQRCENVASRLRAGDALHLSVAKRCLATHIFSLDTDMLNNAIALGMSRMDHDDLAKPSR